MVYLLISVCLIGSLLFIAPVVTYAETEAEIASNEQYISYINIGYLKQKKARGKNMPRA